MAYLKFTLLALQMLIWPTDMYGALIHFHFFHLSYFTTDYWNVNSLKIFNTSFPDFPDIKLLTLLQLSISSLHFIWIIEGESYSKGRLRNFDKKWRKACYQRKHINFVYQMHKINMIVSTLAQLHKIIKAFRMLTGSREITQ